ncbi:MAG: VCBS repeat-containing protein [Gomphosphaeria aponina SAG 52.96 = DSM 107014]|uniref:VCBS repeat-containing protein n=1 Tax=Gomphosphaeria aponina SAG 52.96 = DSM 107014 TaxID=1521640 RepID=A0A941GX48_9CHRO|nr:VCBS repeat-containing protein [Gomphosphaeria aponina SAG 52.96 = DSM 107014]
MTLPVFELVTGTDNPFNDIDVSLAAAPVFVDLDNDEDKDLVIGDYEGYLYYYLNDNGNWVQQTGTNNPFDGFRKGGYLAPAFIDVEGDGDQDLLAGDYSGNITFLLNENGNFVEKTGSDNPFDSIDFVYEYPNPTFSDV